MDALRKHFPWLTDTEAAWLRTELLRRAASGFEQVQNWRDAADCWAELGESQRASELYARGGDLHQAAHALLRAGHYAAALDRYRTWATKLPATDLLNRIRALLGQAACHHLGSRRQPPAPDCSIQAAHTAYRQAYEFIQTATNHHPLTAAAGWRALGDYGAWLHRLDLIQTGYEQALHHLPATARRDQLAIGRAYLAALRTLDDQLLRRQVEERLAEWGEGEPPQFPWADDEGTDEYGHWVTFSIEDEQGNKVTQRMRWIEPRTFQMGSLENEPERWDEEGPQHQVNISQGFWLFDTACTQALWQAVMGNNPSRFQGTDRPVENVSWNDCQDFLKKLNERLPGLDLDLPSEAQWEYACRAGTTTPFSFGANITPEQVNYNGNYPYAGGQKGLFRGETVPVASLPPNPWGLYEMHGNVWEWTQDHWHADYRGAPTDGSAWEGTEAGAYRVLRGGSWLVDGRVVRAAVRIGRAPGLRRDGLGFRCARVQGEQSKPASTVGQSKPASRSAGQTLAEQRRSGAA